MTIERKVYTAKEVAQVLGLSSKTIHRMIASGILPCMNLGGQTVRIPKEKFDQWFQEQERLAERIQQQRRNPKCADM
jgi:excisionase family DNA binding protein